MAYPALRPILVPSTRFHSSQATSVILHIPSAAVYSFSATNPNKPSFNVNWTIRQGESWAIVGHAGEAKGALLDTLKGQTRIKPVPPKGIWPFLCELGLDPVDHVRSVSFAHRPRAVSGGFYDYSARYGAVREEDRLTFRQSLLDSHGEPVDEDAMMDLLDKLDLRQFLDLPLIALSNGQTRRARILKALLRKPKVLLLDEPLTGLDVLHRPRLLSILHDLHKSSSPHIIMSLRSQDAVPEWITHVALVRPGGKVVTATKAALQADLDEHYAQHHITSQGHGRTENNSTALQKPIIIDMRDVNVAYYDRHILHNITWAIREGQRWLLQGPNGSGKTTLLSMITGDHPQSFTQKHLYLFDKPRRRLATPQLASLIGISSPEIFNAFPRRTGPNGLTVHDAIVTGFEGIYTYRKPTPEQSARVNELLEALGPAAWSDDPSPERTLQFANKVFADLTPGEQSLILLLRALAPKPKLLILDEAFSGMDDMMIKAATSYLREKLSDDQSVIWVSHWQGEAPWGAADAVRKFTLEQGRGKID